MSKVRSKLTQTIRRPLDALRQIKHALLLTRRRLHRRREAARIARFRRFPEEFSWDRARYVIPAEGGANEIHADSTFPVNHALYDASEAAPHPLRRAPMRLFLLWTGDNPLTAARERSVGALRRNNPDLEVVLVTPSNLKEWELSDSPVHPSYSSLSLVHRSDYLRAYLMHHHGGVYADIKPITGSLSSLVTQINSSENIWGGGMPELGPYNVGAAVGGRLGDEQRRNYFRLPAASCHAFKARSAFTSEWFAEVNRRMDYFSSLLEKHPATDPLGLENRYPVPWFGLLGTVFGPLSLKYLDHLVVDSEISWSGPSAPESYR